MRFTCSRVVTSAKIAGRRNGVAASGIRYEADESKNIDVDTDIDI